MPGFDIEDRNASLHDPSTDPTHPLTQKQMQGAQRAAVNRTRLPPGQPKSGGQPQQPKAQTSAPGGNGQAQDQTDQETEQEAPHGGAAQTPTPSKGIGQAWQALNDGIAEVTKDPQWMKHPLLRLFADPTGDPNQMGQDLWSATQWWGRVLNAAIDPNAIHASAENIAHDNSAQGRIAQAVFHIHDDPLSEFAWNVIPYGLQMAAEWEPWMWGPSVAAGGPQQLNQVPQALMNLFGSDLSHPQFEDPMWYARMGSYVLAGVVAARGGGQGASKILKFSGRMKSLEPFAELADRILGGPGSKTPIKGPDGQVYDPNSDPLGHAHAQWWQDNLGQVEEGESAIGKSAASVEKQLIANPEIEGAYKEVTSADPKARAELASKLGLSAAATASEVRDKLSMLAEERELSPQLSEQILDNWDRYGPAIGMMGKIKYWHPGEEPLRDVLASVRAIPAGDTKEAASSAMRMANGLRADLKAGVHSYGNDLVEALSKGVLSHSRSSNYYGTKVIESLLKVLPTAQAREAVTRAIEQPEAMDENRRRLEDIARSGDWYKAEKARQELERLGPTPKRYDSLPEEQKWAVDFARRLIGEVRAHKMLVGRQLEAQPNFVYSVPRRVKNLERILAGIPEDVRMEARRSRGRTPFAHVRQEHRAVQLVGSPEGELRAETAYQSRQEANSARAQWRAQMKQDLLARAVSNPKLKAVVDDAEKLNALLHAELPDFSTDIVEILRDGLLPDIKATHTHEVMEAAKNTLIEDPKDGRLHPLAVSRSEAGQPQGRPTTSAGRESVGSRSSRSEAGQESSPTLDPHFKELHGANTTSDFYSGLGYKQIQGLSAGNYIFHPRFADPINTSINFAKGDADLAWRALTKASGLGKSLIMLNPMWHATNMMGRFTWLASAHPVEIANALLKAKGLKKGMSRQQGQEWWAAQEHEAMGHGLLPPQLNEDVVSDVGRYHAQATGDLETGLPMDTKTPVRGLSVSAADALDAVKGAHAWWQNHVNSLLWQQVHRFSVLAYIALKDDALKRGMPAGDARLMAASQANAWAGMVSPDRWMYSPTMYHFSQAALFAPNWWRTFPRLILNSYDRLGMKVNPALTHAWALNTAKTIGTMVLMKAATDNALNWLMSGHWQFQNPPGYQNQVTMDRFAPVDPKTGAHTVMEDPFERQPNDLEKALGLYEAIQNGEWKPQYAEEGTAEVVAARASPLLQALEVAGNLNLYETFKKHNAVWFDPQHPYPGGGPDNWLAALSAFTPVGFAAQSVLQGATAQPGTLDWGPFQGTQIPGWAMYAFSPNDPLSGLMNLLGARGGYPAPVKTAGGAGLGTYELNNLHQFKQQWSDWLQKHQVAVQTGGMTWSEWAYQYKLQSAAYANRVQGATANSSEYEQGAEGVLAQYEAIYNNKQSFDANGDINWAAVQQQQDQLQAKTDTATWRQAMAIKDQREMQYPILRVYKDTMQNYHNWQDTEAKALGTDPETLRALIAEGAQAPDFKRFEASHPVVSRYYVDKRRWELTTKQGFAYGLFTNNSYVMRIVAPGGTTQQAEQAETKILPQIEQMEQAGEFVTPTGE